MFKFIGMFLLLTSLFNGPVLAQDMIEGEGRFQSTQDDSLTFVRNQLLYQAYRDVLSKEMKSLGLDARAFWQKYEERFQNSFDTVRGELVEKYKVTSGDANARQKLEYERALRSRELNARSRFGNIARAIESYSIKNMSRSAQAAQSRFLTLQARVNRRMLNSVYNEFMREGKGRYFSQVIITPEFQLKEGSWTDLGVETESELTGVVKQHWMTWFKNNLTRFVHHPELGDREMEKKIEEYMRLSPDIFSSDSQSLESESEEMERENNQPFKRDMTSTLSNSLWLKLQLSLAKVRENLVLQNRTLRYSGEMILIDLKTKQIIHAQDFAPEEHTYTFEDNHALSSNIASFLYRMPVAEFEKIAKIMQQMDSRAQMVKLTLSNMKSIEDFYQFRDVLVKKGVTEDFGPKLIEYNGAQATVELYFKGERSVAFERLRSIDGVQLSDEKSVRLQSTERPLEFNMQFMTLPPVKGEDVTQRS